MQELLEKLALPVLHLPRATKRLVALVVDTSLCVIALWLALYLRLGEWTAIRGHLLWVAASSIAIAIPIFVASGLYRAIFRYSGLTALRTVAKAVFSYGLAFFALYTLIGFEDVPRTIGLIQPLLVLLLVGGSRVFARFWLGGVYQSKLALASVPRALVYGAGNAGRQLAAGMVNSHEMRVVGYVDDDPSMHGQVLDGLPIYSPEDLVGLAETQGISDVLLALPSAGRKRRNEILSLMSRARVAVRTLPSLNDLVQGRVSVSDLRELDIDDILGRDPVVPDGELLASRICGKVVMVTGAGGSIGSELCRQIQELVPATLLLIEQSEFALYAIHQELEEKISQRATVVVPLLASVQDRLRMDEIMRAWRPHTVYHAAAYKHVPLVEHNPAEGIRNNVLGTLHTAQVAAANGVADFVLVSTDKAVRPTNVMGASKRLAEMSLQAMADANPSTRFSMVRFGNVLGSSGSVVPRFRQQIRDGGPITLTHPDITRYFMTIPEAAQLVIQAGAMAKGGEVFVLDMGTPVRILDLARRMVELSGLVLRNADEPEGDIAIEITGLRPGEKLYEELLIGDNPHPTSHPRIMMANEEYLPWPDMQRKLERLESVLNANDVGAIREQLQQLVNGYSPDGAIVDWVHLAQRDADTKP
jgi:FlaA1/EpsC-like NDP-sugar epimerase